MAFPIHILTFYFLLSILPTNTLEDVMPTKKRTRLSKEDVVKILEKVLVVFSASTDEFYYRHVLNAHGINPSQFCHWIKKGDKEIDELYQTLESIQENKIVSGMLNKKSNINTTGAIFYLKAKKGWIERDKQLALEKPATQISDFNININYDTIPSRSMEEIDTIIVETEKEN